MSGFLPLAAEEPLVIAISIHIKVRQFIPSLCQYSGRSQMHQKCLRHVRGLRQE